MIRSRGAVLREEQLVVLDEVGDQGAAEWVRRTPGVFPADLTAIPLECGALLKAVGCGRLHAAYGSHEFAHELERKAEARRALRASRNEGTIKASSA